MKKRLLSLLLAVTMITSMFNTVALAANTEEQKTEETQIVCEICGHEHDETCGYVEAVEGQPCSHAHSEACGYEAGIDGAPCSHVHTEECYEMVTNCMHEHTGVCYPIADSGTEAIVPDDANNDSTELQIDDKFLIAMPSEPTECTHECNLDNGCIIKKLNCTHEHNTDECGYTASAEGVLCNHQHNEDCGFIEAIEGKPCTHKCIVQPLTQLAPATLTAGVEYKVATAEAFSAALASIAADSSATEAVIVLESDITVTPKKATTKEEKAEVGGSSPENCSVMGVPGKHITITSEGDNPHKITGGISGYLVGDVTFDRIIGDYYQDVFANGHVLEFTENFGGNLGQSGTRYIYGGSDRRSVENTHLILNGGAFDWVYGGGYSGGMGTPGKPSLGLDDDPGLPGWQPPVFQAGTGDVKQNVVIEVGGSATLSTLTGGGRNANVGGNVTMTIASDSGDTRTAGWIAGSGYANKAGYGNVLGDVTINAYSGNTTFLWGTGSFGGSIDAMQPNGIVVGQINSIGRDLTITVGTENGTVPMVIGAGSSYETLVACGTSNFNSDGAGAVVTGNVSIVLNDTAQIRDTQYGNNNENNIVYAAGPNSIVYGSASITNNGAANVYSLVGCAESGKIMNRSDAENALTIIQNDGELRQSPTGKNINGALWPTYSSGFISGKPAEINGNVYFEVNGGSLHRADCDWTSDVVQIRGDAITKITEGTIVCVYGGLRGGALVDDAQYTSTVIFDGYDSPTESKNKVVYCVGYSDDIILENNSTVLLKGDSSHTPFFSDDPATGVKNLTVESGSTLALLKSGTISGDLSVAGTLALPRTDNKSDKTQPGTTVTLTAGGTATGTAGSLQPINSGLAGWGMLIDSTPVANEEYVYAKKDGSDMELGLTDAKNGLYVGRKEKAANTQDVWYIAQDLTKTYTVTFDPQGGIWSDGTTANKVVNDVALHAKISAPVETLSTGGKDFGGWYTEPDGKGTKWDFETNTVTKNITLYAQWTAVSTYTVTYTDGVDGEEIFADQTTSGLVSGEATPVFSGTPTRSGYTFTGWSPAVAATVAGNATYTAQWSRNSSGGGGGTTYYTLAYESNGGTEYKSERYASGTTVKLDKVPSRTGYSFTGWYAEQTLTTVITEVKMTSNKTVYAGWRTSTVPDMLNGDDHFAYVVGYTDGLVRPLNNITRAEVATIFFRLLKDDVRDKNLTATNTFTDVVAGTWCNKPISTMATLGVVKGRSDQIFDPEAAITRAEFATICARFDTTVTNGNSNFTDISGHWAQADIERAATLGWIQGYTDGTFRPEQYITRAEAMTMINRVLCRIPEDEDDLLKDMIVWPDNQPGVWYYLAVQEATNGHDYTPKGEVYEHWAKLIAAPDWTKYEN